MKRLNLGILAHVDAGKTTLTERLLFAAGVIEKPGSVDKGTTQTDFLPLERQRGITIRSAVVSFAIGDVTINLIDTPGHPDFIAEVERVLSVLDGAVLVISAVEGVQPQTRILMRTLQRLRIPTLIFVNKIDRGGAAPERVFDEIAAKLTPAVVATGLARDAGTRRATFVPFEAGDASFAGRLAEMLAERDDRILGAYLDDPTTLPFERLRKELATQVKAHLVHPVFFGSAISGAGIEALSVGIRELLPAAGDNSDGPLSAAVFKVERGRAGEKIAYVRVFSGAIRVRDRVTCGSDREGRITGIGIFGGAATERADSIEAGQIGKLWGLPDVRVGDSIGEAADSAPAGAPRHYFAPPTLETLVVPCRAADKNALLAALSQLAEQDPLINLRQDDIRGELFVSLYGEVQKEVVSDTLALEYGIEVEFRETTTICIERPVCTGRAVEIVGEPSNPFIATVGFRIDPAPIGSGVQFRLEVELGSIPLSYHKAVEESVLATLREGLHGWEVTDCAVTLTHAGYVSLSSTAGDFRNLTPLVLMDALRRAGTVVHEPIHRFRLEAPADSLGPVLSLLSRLEAAPEVPSTRVGWAIVGGTIPADRVAELRRFLPGASRGEGILETVFERYEPVRGAVSDRPRTDHNPLNRKEYLMHVRRVVA